MDDEAQANRLAYAITKAFAKPSKSSIVEDDEEVIDTTAPEFAEKFKGFTNTPGARNQQRTFPQRGTEILRG
jgi:hypothetical protein